ncbi:MAG: hypothetical protein JW833_10495 [Prolixibacteraceae bacterium]|nr:hypothetical protein [Prolixibacteraceae bacterium]
MNTALLHIHNILRWLVLVTAAFAIIRGFIGWFGNKKWTKTDNFSGLLFTIIIDLQLLAGIVLYAFYSPLVKLAFNDFGAAMKNETLRFFAVEHILMMVIATVVIHIGRSKSKKSKTPVKQHRSATIFYTIGIILILAAIPWDRALI